jgi:hypothetical protein
LLLITLSGLHRQNQKSYLYEDLKRKSAMRDTHHHSWVLHRDAGSCGSQGSTDAVVVFKTDFYLRCKAMAKQDKTKQLKH